MYMRNINYVCTRRNIINGNAHYLPKLPSNFPVKSNQQNINESLPTYLPG